MTLANENANEAPPYDLVLVTDATASMGTYLRALNTSLPQILALAEVTSAFQSVGVLAYRDYGEKESEIIEWSGWYSSNGDGSERSVDLFGFAKGLQAIGGDDYPEAAKTAIWKLLGSLNPGRRTLAVWYCDAPPHHPEARSWGGNREKEIKRLEAAENTLGKTCTDWFKACQALCDAKVQVLTLLSQGMTVHESYYVMMARCTGGTTVRFTKDANHRDISVSTMELLLAFLDQHRENRDKTKCLVETINYTDVKGFEQISGEGPKEHMGFLPEGGSKPKKGLKHVEFSEKHVRRRVGTIPDFSKRFQEDPEYKKQIYKSLANLIELDVTAISLNPIFGELWRVVCRERLSDERTAIVNTFSNAASRLPEGADKQNMTAWLEESYDATKDIRDIIEQVDSAEKYPAVCVDPTESKIGPDHWVRSELLEVGRSCYAGVLKRLGAILAKDLVFIQDEASCPAHLRDDSVVPKLPFALVKKQHARAFWKILLHLILPGTMLAARAGNVLAALSIKLGIPFLKGPASEALRAWRGKWSDIETAENWSLDIMKLLLSVDDIGAKEGVNYLDPKTEGPVFRNLVDYKMAELNLETELAARIPFTPEKTVGYRGPVAKCGVCKHERSVTVMGTGRNKGRCGLCLWEPTNAEERKKKESILSSRAKDEKLPWVECGQSECRAAYVVYAVEDLNVRPKCFYHRFPEEADMECPWVECTKCKNRVIWPKDYREGNEKDFLCVFCEEGRETIESVPTTANRLIKENGAQWILGKDGAEKIGFKGRSIYAVAKEVTVETIQTCLEVLPENERGPEVLKNKPIQNVEEVKAEFAKWVREGRIETKTCTLCFDSKFKPSELFLACGRRGCLNKVDAECLKEWYGMNRPGRIINFNALHCPFCRRLPSPKVLSNFSLGIRAVSSLDQALQERGTWIHAWCITCSSAKRVMERVCQAGGTPIELENWNCEDCSKVKVIGSKHCPGCGIATEKSSGCNHIKCPVESCSVHWCYQCCEPFPEWGIYNHMENEHGGIYGIGGDEEEEEEDY